MRVSREMDSSNSAGESAVPENERFDALGGRDECLRTVRRYARLPDTDSPEHSIDALETQTGTPESRTEPFGDRTHFTSETAPRTTNELSEWLDALTEATRNRPTSKVRLENFRPANSRRGRTSANRTSMSTSFRHPRWHARAIHQDGRAGVLTPSYQSPRSRVRIDVD